MKDKKYTKEELKRYTDLKSPIRSLELKHKADMISKDDSYLDDMKAMRTKVRNLIDEPEDDFEEADDKAYINSPEGKKSRSQEARKEMLKMISNRYKGMK